MSVCYPTVMNIELTTNCPLHCPQCYCTLTGGNNIEREKAIYWIREGSKLGVKDVMLSGGETLCYPYLYEIIEAANLYCGHSNVSLSGAYFTQQVFDKLQQVKVSRIFISLNGSNEEVNSLSRDGFALSLNALELLKKNKYRNTIINWVMHRNNADDFPNMVKIAEKYDVSTIVILGLKPDSNHSLGSIPTKEQMKNVRDIIRSYKGKVRIMVENCFSPMLALLGETLLFGNLNVGRNNGCGAGYDTFSVNVDGLLSPCRHLNIYEQFENGNEYWNSSPILQELRKLREGEAEEPCNKCSYTDYCKPCFAITKEVEKRLYKGNPFCPLQ
ncbi:MAG: radical SAM protein [Clostridia bacterium]|nr:radical SAM protein [Clostridia bacterium]